MKIIFKALLISFLYGVIANAALMDDLMSDNSDMREKAKAILSSQSVENKLKNITALLDVYKTRQKPEANYAGEALSAAGASVVGPVLGRMKGDETADRSFYMGIIIDMGAEAAMELARFLNNDDKKLRIAAAVALIARNENIDKAVSVVSAYLKAEVSDSLFVLCLNSIGKVKEVKPAVITVVAEKLSDKNNLVRGAALRVLGNLGPKAGIVTKEIIPLIKDDIEENRVLALIAVSKIGEEAFECLPELLTLLKSENKLLVHNAIAAIEGIGVDPAKCVPALQELLLNEDLNLRASAASGIGSFGPAASGAVPALCKALKTATEDYEQTKILQALGSIFTEDAKAEVKAFRDKRKPKINKRK